MKTEGWEQGGKVKRVGSEFNPTTMSFPLGLELETPSLVPVKKNASAVVVSDKYNLKPIPLKRQRYRPCSGFLNGLGVWTRGRKKGLVDVVDSSSSNSSTASPGDAAPPAEKKYKPLNTTPNATKEIKVKIIPPQRESTVGGSTLIWEQDFMGMNVLGRGKLFFSLLLFSSDFLCPLIFVPLELPIHRIT